MREHRTTSTQTETETVRSSVPISWALCRGLGGGGTGRPGSQPPGAYLCPFHPLRGRRGPQCSLMARGSRKVVYWGLAERLTRPGLYLPAWAGDETAPTWQREVLSSIPATKKRRLTEFCTYKTPFPKRHWSETITGKVLSSSLPELLSNVCGK